MTDTGMVVKEENTSVATIGEEMAGVLVTEQEQARYSAEAEIKAAVVMARQFPRSTMRAYANLMESCKRPSFANEVRYSFPRGGGKVEGPSVVLAREAARCWGNVRYGVEVTFDDPHRRKVCAWAWDIETNTKVTHEDEFEKLIQRKYKDNGETKTKWIKPDERDLRELTNRRAAMAVRNCILQLIPRDFIEDALSQATETIAKAVKASPQDQLKKIIKGFAVWHVTAKMIERWLGHTIDEITPNEIVDLHGIFTSIKEGNSAVDEYFTVKDKEPEPAEGTKKKPAEKLRETPESKRAKNKVCADCGNPADELSEYKDLMICIDCYAKRTG